MFAELRDRIQARLLAGLPAHVDRLGWDTQRLREWQRDRLRRLLAVAKRRSAFHAGRLRGVDPARFELAGLAGLPVMTKAQMMAGDDTLVTDPRLTRAAAEAALAATGTEPRPLPGGFLCLATGGSSGERGIVAYAPEAAAEFVSLMFRTRIAALAGQLKAPVQLPPASIAFVAASSAVHGTVFVSSILGGTPVRIVHVPVTLPVPEIVGRLNQLQPRGLFGYASMLARLAAEHQAGRLRVAPQLVSCTAETLLPEFRAAIKGAFGVPITNTFGSTEGPRRIQRTR